MDRINLILSDEVFSAELKCIEEYEADRIYCRHGITHLLDVARIGVLYAYEHEAEISPEIIYAAALLHDIGRGRQYKYGENHDTAGAVIAEGILRSCGFEEAEISLILEAIEGHRGKSEVNDLSLAEIIKKADNDSRLCFMCRAYDTCKWSEERKNKRLNWKCE